MLRQEELVQAVDDMRSDHVSFAGATATHTKDMSDDKSDHALGGYIEANS